MDKFPLPERMPVMVLSNCFLLPGCLMPLFIFEERYRLMVRYALKADRMFCVGIRKRTCGDCGQEEVLPYTTAGLIRACVRNEDGTSQLMLHGVRRIRIKGTDNRDSLRGIGLAYVVLDEYADMDPGVWGEIIRPALMDAEGGALFIAHARPAEGHPAAPRAAAVAARPRLPAFAPPCAWYGHAHHRPRSR